MDRHDLEEVYTFDRDFDRFEALMPLRPG